MADGLPRPGLRNLITDVGGLRVGSAEDEKAATGVTVLLCETSIAAAVDVRGGGPGLRETETLSAENLVGRADAIVLTGGSVFGLAAADGVTSLLSEQGTGLHLTAGTPAIPIVPAAVLHDLGNEGDKSWGLEPPYRALGIAAANAALPDFQLGARGAGRGAKAGLIKGGLGSASLDLGGGLIVGALVAVNPVGSVLMPDGKTFWAWPFELDQEFGGARPDKTMPASDPFPEQSRLAARGRLAAGANTTIAIVATSARLAPAECKRVAMMAQDGLSRAIRPAHTPFDGDTVFAVSMPGVEIGDEAPTRERQARLGRVGSAAADCLARAIARGVYAAMTPA